MSLNALAFTSHFKCTLSLEFNERDILTQSFTCSLISEKLLAFWRQINPHVKFCHGRCVFQEWCKNSVPDCNPNERINPKCDGLDSRGNTLEECREILSNRAEKERERRKPRKSVNEAQRRENHIAWGDADSWRVHQHYWLNYGWINKRPERVIDAEERSLWF